MDFKHAGPSALPTSWTLPQTVNMKDHGRKSSWTAQLSPYLRGLKIKNIIPSPKSPKSPESPISPKSPSSPRTLPEVSTFHIIHTPDRPERPISRRAIPNDEQCMEFLMALQRHEEYKRGCVKTGLKMWPYPEDETEDRRYLRSVRVESVHLEEARLARTNSSGPARVVEVRRSSTKSSMATRLSGYTTTPSISDAGDADNEPKEYPKMTALPLSPPPTLSRSHSRLSQHMTRVNTSRWSDDSLDSLFSSRDVDSPCPQRRDVHSSAGASSPTVFDGDDSAGRSTPLLHTLGKDRPATPFTDPHLGAAGGLITPPPSNHIAHHIDISPEPAPRKYSWRSSRDTILDSGAPMSRFQSWLPEPQAKEIEIEESEPEGYGDWADYYFEDCNFSDKGDSYGNKNSDETRVDEEGDANADDEQNEYEVEENEGQKDQLQADNDSVYRRYESFIEDYKTNVTSATVTGV